MFTIVYPYDIFMHANTKTHLPELYLQDLNSIIFSTWSIIDTEHDMAVWYMYPHPKKPVVFILRNLHIPIQGLLSVASR
jgi:hypothetical protein